MRTRSELSEKLQLERECVKVAEETIRKNGSEITLLKSEIQTARRQRDDANTHSGIVTKYLEAANTRIKSSNDHIEKTDRKISEINIGMGELNRQVIRWKSAFLAVLFVVALPSIATASAAVYLLTHR
ncbi:MAG: hypothetical protein QMC36_05270 [Patescibacteria group bacterium]